MGRNRRKQVQKSAPVTDEKRVKMSPARSGDETIRFRFGSLDLDGPWCLSKIDPQHFRELLPKLGQIEGMTVTEAVDSAGGFGKRYDMSQCPNPKAVQRLTEHFDSRDDMARFRVNGKQRLYGFLENGDFSIVWWDPKHEIWPSPKKHT